MDSVPCDYHMVITKVLSRDPVYARSYKVYHMMA